VTQVPGSLEKVLESLEADNGYLQEGGVFTGDLISTWVDYKRSNEIDPVRLRPTPHEFAMYYDV
jgi:glutamine synthetase